MFSRMFNYRKKGGLVLVAVLLCCVVTVFAEEAPTIAGECRGYRGKGRRLRHGMDLNRGYAGHALCKRVLLWSKRASHAPRTPVTS